MDDPAHACPSNEVGDVAAAELPVVMAMLVGGDL